MTRYRLVSDIGGTRLGEPIDRSDHAREQWKVLCDGVRGTMVRKGIWRTDEGRRAAEDLGPDLYPRLSYYERKVLAAEAVLIEKGLLDPEELPPLPAGVPPAAERRSAPPDVPADEARPEPRFSPGQRVRVRDWWPSGHHRTPGYVRGKPGRVVGVHGPFPNPERLAYGESGEPAQWLYTLEFNRATLWPEDNGPPGHRVQLDIYDHWIEEADEADE